MKRVSGAGLALICGLAWGQSVQTPPEFELADVQVSKPGSSEASLKFLPGGKLQAFGVTLQDLILIGWNLDENRISGAPAWLDTDRFDIVAKAPHAASDDALRLMLQALLAQRFGLKVHQEDKTIPVYALVVGKRGARLKASESQEESGCPLKLIDGARTLICKGVTMAEFADRIRQAAAAYLDHPVVDLTGITGRYDFTVAWMGKGKVMGTANGRGGEPGATPQASEPSGGLTVFDAVDKYLGLRLESQKRPLATVVIDAVNRKPTGQ